MSLLFAASSVFAQKAVTVQGVVTDATFNEPVIGANVLVKGTTVGTICDMDGKYLIENVPAVRMFLLMELWFLALSE